MTNQGNQPLLLDPSTFDHNGNGLKQSGHQHNRQDSHRDQQDNVHVHGVFLSSVKKVGVRATTSISPRRQVSSHSETCLPWPTTPCGVAAPLNKASNRPLVISTGDSFSSCHHHNHLLIREACFQYCAHSEIPCRESVRRTRRGRAPMR